ncbi:hypothetical protein [Paenibacillus senegalimassiliensis]|uniref:hypothetical protein n=1 Tax=Paenibacillus senegalimassiliensis TaxID=1737426 RepID=UPI00073EBA9E|nr:hypothetical protein [Paenibacillus senegalimassiliensis]
MRLNPKLKIYKENDKLLNSFQISIINQFETELAKDILISEHYANERDEEEQRWHYKEISVRHVVSIMNALGISIDQFEKTEQYSEEASEPYYTYNFNKVWEFLKQLSPYEFLVAMVTVTQTSSKMTHV